MTAGSEGRLDIYLTFPRSANKLWRDIGEIKQNLQRKGIYVSKSGRGSKGIYLLSIKVKVKDVREASLSSVYTIGGKNWYLHIEYRLDVEEALMKVLRTKYDPCMFRRKGCPLIREQQTLYKGPLGGLN